MPHRLFSPCAILPTLALLAGFAWSAAAPADPRPSSAYGGIPLHFEANGGQTHGDVRFLAHGAGYVVLLTANTAVLKAARPLSHAERGGRSAAEPRRIAGVALRMSLAGASAQPNVSALEPLRGKTNYVVGSDPSKWRTNVPTYAKVRFADVYPGIDIVYHGDQRQLEMVFVIAPGADSAKVAIDFQGIETIEVDDDGDLVLHAGAETLRVRKPLAYQDFDGVRRAVDARYVIESAKRVGFSVGPYDRARPLVVDPVFAYAAETGTLSGSRSEYAAGIAVDAGGNAYVTGGTLSTDFPTTFGGFQTTFAGYDGLNEIGDGYITKIDSTGTTLIYSTYLGGSSGDEATGIAVDADGNAHVVGFTNSFNFPTTAGALQNPRDGGRPGSAFFAKLSSDGSALLYSTYLGGTRYDHATGVTLDAAGNTYVTGFTFSEDFPVTAEAVQPIFAGPVNDSGDAFVTKFSAADTLVYSTYLGGSAADCGYGIAADSGGSAYVTGQTDSVNFPVTAGAFQAQRPSDASNVFVAKLDASGSTLVYSTYLGGNSPSTGTAIAVDADGNGYVAGSTSASDFPTTTAAFQTTPSGAGDAFVAKLNASGSALIYSTLLGGTSLDIASGISVDPEGYAHVTGATWSTNFPVTPDAFQSALGGGGDAFVTNLNPTGSALTYSTYLGGTGTDRGIGIATNSFGDALIVGSTDSPDFPTTHAFGTSSGGFDAFIVKIGDEASQPTSTREEGNAATYAGDGAELTLWSSRRAPAPAYRMR